MNHIIRQIRSSDPHRSNLTKIIPLQTATQRPTEETVRTKQQQQYVKHEYEEAIAATSARYNCHDTFYYAMNNKHLIRNHLQRKRDYSVRKC